MTQNLLKVRTMYLVRTIFRRLFKEKPLFFCMIYTITWSIVALIGLAMFLSSAFFSYAALFSLTVFFIAGFLAKKEFCLLNCGNSLI